MVLTVPAALRGPFQATRFAVLVLGCLLVAHTAVFVAQYGLGAGFDDAMTRGGHDGYWFGWTAFVTSAGAVIGALGAWRVIHTVRRSRQGLSRAADSVAAPPRTYAAELLHLWPRLFLAVTLGFVIQENVEHVLASGHVVGLWALGGSEYPLALPTLLGVTLAVAALGAFVRWRVGAFLKRRPGTAGTLLGGGGAPARPTARWALTAALCLRHWILARRLTGRAPPVAALA